MRHDPTKDPEFQRREGVFAQTTKAGITPGPYAFRYHVQLGGRDMLKAREIGLINACRIYSGGLMMLFRKFALASGFIFPLLSPVSAQVSSDPMGGFRSVSPDGSIRHYSSDGMGGFRSVSPDGSITHYSSDGTGGFRSVSPDGSTKHYPGDGMGGFRSVGPDGSVTHYSSDAVGGGAAVKPDGTTK
jgi:hypothetical protein